MDFGPKKVVFECVYSEKSTQKWFLNVISHYFHCKYTQKPVFVCVYSESNGKSTQSVIGPPNRVREGHFLKKSNREIQGIFLKKKVIGKSRGFFWKMTQKMAKIWLSNLINDYQIQ